MDQIIAKIKDGRKKYYLKLLSGHQLFVKPEFEEVFEYQPDTSLNEMQWYVINDFSEKPYCIDLLKDAWDSTNFTCGKIEIDKIEYICSYQEGNYFYFQKVSKKTMLKNKKFLSFGDQTVIHEQKDSIVIGDYPDAVYCRGENRLYFKKLEAIASIFKGIDELYREATHGEVKAFLNSDFIVLDDTFEVASVWKLNRKRIALATDIMSSLDKNQKKDIFAYIRDYHPDLSDGKKKFKVSNNEDLKNILYGIEQRYFTTPVTEEKKVATSAMAV